MSSTQAWCFHSAVGFLTIYLSQKWKECDHNNSNSTDNKQMLLEAPSQIPNVLRQQGFWNSISEGLAQRHLAWARTARLWLKDHLIYMGREYVGRWRVAWKRMPGILRYHCAASNLRYQKHTALGREDSGNISVCSILALQLAMYDK